MTGKSEERNDGGGFFAKTTKAEKRRLGVNIFTKVFIVSLSHTKSARGLGPPASVGYF